MMMQVNKKCQESSCPPIQYVAYYWPDKDGCFCGTDDFFATRWNYLLPGDLPADVAKPKPIFEVERNELLLRKLIEDIQAKAGYNVEFSNTVFHSQSFDAEEMLKYMWENKTYASPHVDDNLRVHKRQDDQTPTSTQTSTSTVVPTFVPPPKEDITPKLLNESLSIQPQNAAVVASVIAHLRDEVITFFLQLDGRVANLIAMNASTTFPCGSIGTDPQPDIMLVPKHVKQGGQQTIIADCRCIAVNQLKPDIINYWVQTAGGSIYSLVSRNLVSHIDQIDTTARFALSIIPAPTTGQKRSELEEVNTVELPRRQVFKADVCDRRCPEGMQPIPGDLLKNPPECGCLVAETRKVGELTARELIAPGPYTATMSEEACKAMKCTNNNDEPPMWNPFDMHCWCTDSINIEENSSAWTPGGPVKE